MMSKKKVVKWVGLTIVMPPILCMLTANLYVVGWFVSGHAAGENGAGSLHADVALRAVMITAGFGLWATVGLWWLIFRRRARFADLFGTATDSIGKALLAGVPIGVFWVIVYGLVGWPPFAEMLVIDAGKVASLFTSISAGFCEEFLFRGFVIGVIAATGATKLGQLLWSSFAFGLAHFFWGPVGMLFTFALGLSMAAITLRQGNVWAAVVAHAIINVCIEPALMKQAMTFTRG